MIEFMKWIEANKLDTWVILASINLLLTWGVCLLVIIDSLPLNMGMVSFALLPAIAISVGLLLGFYNRDRS